MKGLHLDLEGGWEWGAWAHLQGKVQGTKAGLVLTFKVRLKGGGYKGFMKGLYGVSKGFLKDL